MKTWKVQTVDAGRSHVPTREDIVLYDGDEVTITRRVTNDDADDAIASARLVVKQSPRAGLPILAKNATVRTVGSVQYLDFAFADADYLTLPTTGYLFGEVALVSGDTITVAAGRIRVKSSGRAPIAATVVVSPSAPSVMELGTQQYTAVVMDRTGLVIPGAPIVWSIPSGGAFASIDPATGLATGTAIGSATIRATSGSVHGDAALTVTLLTTPATVVVSPNPAGIGVGSTQAFTAVVRNLNNTLLPGAAGVWSSLDITRVTVNPATGVATAVGIGATSVRFTAGAVHGDSAITVLSALDGLINALNAAGADVLAVHRAADWPDGSTSSVTPQAAPYYRKPGLTAADVPDMRLYSNTIKTYRAGKPVIRMISNDWFGTPTPANAYQTTLGFSVHWVGTMAGTVDSGVIGMQDVSAGNTVHHGVGVVIDTLRDIRRSVQLKFFDELTPTDQRMHLRCKADPTNIRYTSFSIFAGPGTIESGGVPVMSGNIQRSAEHVIESVEEWIHGKAKTRQNGSACRLTATPLYFYGGIFKSQQTAAVEDMSLLIITRAAQTPEHVFLIQAYAAANCDAVAETGRRVVAIGDSIVHGFTTGLVPDGTTQYNSSKDNADGGNANTQALLAAGTTLSNGAYGGEGLWSIINERATIGLPVWLNARTRSEVIAYIVLGANDSTPNEEYYDLRPAATLYAELVALIDLIRTYPGTIKIVVCNMSPCWVVTGDADPQNSRARQTALNAQYDANLPALVASGKINVYRKVTDDATIGVLNANANTTYYFDKTHMTEAGYDIRRNMLVADVAGL